ncbi:uncharacterized protein LOC118438199 [Folsomia candida]|nr:uncharacterized protein LOC118438199 [Folsomia candida]
MALSRNNILIYTTLGSLAFKVFTSASLLISILWIFLIYIISTAIYKAIAMYKRSVKVADENKKRLSTVLNNQITAMDEVLSNQDNANQMNMRKLDSVKEEYRRQAIAEMMKIRINYHRIKIDHI